MNSTETVEDTSPGAPVEEGSARVREPVRPVALVNVVVTLDGSERATAAVPVARQLAARLGAQLTLVAVSSAGHHDALARHVEQVAGRAGGHPLVVDGDDVPTAIMAALSRLPGHVVCMASHGRGRSAGVVGSVATEIVARESDPLVLVGPYVPHDYRLAGRLLACVDGSGRSELVLPAAASWAGALALGLSVVTVAEPIPQPVTPGADYDRRHGPAGVPEAYVGGLVRRWQGRSLDVDGEAVYDPVSVVGGLVTYMETRPTGLVAAATHARTGMARLVMGSVAAMIVHHLPAPVLLVPSPSSE